MSDQKVKVRIAPSPTGYIHIGTVRTALHCWLFARQNNGTFVLRIEDTDKKREVENGVEIIKNTLEAVNLNWDEYYLQSELKENHKIWAEKLYSKGLAYSDNVAPEEVDAWREDARLKKKPFLYRDYITEDRIVPWEYGKNILRLKSTPKVYKWHDEVRGDLSAGAEAIDDLPLIKSDGYATYNFCHITDDYDMGITHIFRTDEFISSTPKFLSIYEALEITPPKFVTLAPIMAEGGKKKLGKRDGAKDVLEYLHEGVLVEGLINFLALLGWNPGEGNNQEIFSLDELIKTFSLKGLGKSGANFDEKRLEWINGHHIRNLPIDKLYELSKDYLPKEVQNHPVYYQKSVLAIIQERLKFLNEIPELTSFFFAEPKVSKDQLLEVKGIEGNEDATELLKATTELLKSSDFSVDDLQAKLNQLLIDLETKPGILFALIRNSVSGSKVTPGLFEMLNVLGKDITLIRLNSALDTLK